MLIGIHLGCYGKEHDGKLNLFDAVEAALSVEGLQRLRLGSLESVEVEARLLNLMEKDKRLCRQLHLPLQAGCDTTLARMHRPYDTRRFTELLADIRKRIPDIAITTDTVSYTHLDVYKRQQWSRPARLWLTPACLLLISIKLSW